MDGRPGSFATGVFRAQPVDTTQRKIQKRNRPPVSCLLCRTRKVKCDRQQPCERCVKSGEANFCEYAPRAPRKPKASSHDPGHPSPSSLPQDRHAAAAPAPSHHQRAPDPASRPLLQARLKKLEDMINGLVQAVPCPPHGSGSSSGGTAAGPMGTPRSLDRQPADSESRSDYGSPSSSHMPHPAAVMKTTTRFGENTFVGSTHWASVLESIQDIKGIVAATSEHSPESPSPPPQYNSSENLDLLFDRSSITLEQAVSRLPPKNGCDQLILLYFRSKLAAAGFIHTTKFQREYDTFWDRPTSTTFLWISCLASMLCMAASISIGNGTMVSESDPAHPNNTAALAKECLLAGNYLSGKPHAIEALMLNGMTEKARSAENDLSLWAHFGVLVRLAQRMGYHRDPKYIANVTAFEGEMRRRVWFFIEVFDVIFSFQLGLPPIVHSEECDTEAPSNLYDSDFDEHTPVLPPPRPATEPTSTLYLHCKFKLCRLLRKVIRCYSSIRPPQYDEILALSDEIHNYRCQIPPPLQIRPVKQYSFTEQSTDIVHRLLLEMMYLRSLCVLHRPYLNREKDNSRYDISRNTCREAALRMLDLHAEYESEARPGGRLSDEKYIMNTLGMHDFLMASMILCLDLTEKIPITSAERFRIMTALSTSYKMWSERKTTSREAAHATRVVGAILRKLSMQELPTPPIMTASSSSVSTSVAGGASTSPSTNGMSLVNLCKTRPDHQAGTMCPSVGTSPPAAASVPRDGSLASLLNSDVQSPMTPPLSSSMSGGSTTTNTNYQEMANLNGPGNTHHQAGPNDLIPSLDFSLDFGDPGLVPLDNVLSNPSLVDWAFIDQILLDNAEGGFRALQ